MDDIVPPPSDVDMVPDETPMQSALPATDLMMDEDLTASLAVDGGLGEEQMAVSDDEGGGQTELVMEDLEAAPVATDDMLLETVEEDTAAVHDVSFDVEVDEAAAAPEVEVLSETSPAGTNAPLPPPQALAPEPATSVASIEVAAPAPTTLPEATAIANVEVIEAKSASPITESFVLVEVPSDAEDNGPAGDLAVEDPEAEVAEAADETVAVDDAQHEEEDELEDPYPESNDHDHHGGDSSSISSSQADPRPAPDPDAETALFHVSERSSQMPVTISYQRINVEAGADALETVTYALFQPSDRPSSSTAPPLRVILDSQQSLFSSKLTDLFDALREEAAFASEPGVLAIEDEEGTREWVLEHVNEAICLSVGEDNTSAREFTLADLAHVHTLCDLPEPLELRLKPGDIRFKQRIEMIKGMRDVMDGEESVGDVDELENDQAAHTEMHDASFSDGGYVESGDEEEPEVTSRPDYEQGEGDIDELAEETDDDDVTEIDPPTNDHADDSAQAEELEDYPNGPDDPDLQFEQTDDAPGRKVEIESEEAEDTTDFAIDAARETVDETDIVTDSKIVQTATGDIEVPAAAHHVETALGSFDEAEAVRQVGEATRPVETIADGAVPEVLESSEEAAALAHEVELEAAADSTAGGVVEHVPIPAQFAHDADEIDDSDDPEAMLVIEKEGAADDAVASTQAMKRKRAEREPSAETAEMGDAAVTKRPGLGKAARTAEDELYGDSPAPTPAPDAAAAASEVAQGTDPVDGSEEGEDHASDITLADSDLIVVGEEDEPGADDADDAGGDEDRDAKRLRAD